MILAGQLVTNLSSGESALGQGWLKLNGHLIVDRGVGKCPHEVDFGDEETLISPGFVDAHVHLPQFDVIGAEGMTLLEWLNKVVFPAEARWEDVCFAESMASRVYRQFVEVGTTAFVAFATVHHESTLAALNLAEEFGFRCAIGQVLMDRNAPDYLLRPASQLAREAESILRRFDRRIGSRVCGAIAPRFAISCTDSLLQAAGRLAKQFAVPIETHLAETQEECVVVGQLFDDSKDYTSVYEQFGLVTDRTLFGHCIWLSDDERHRLAAAGAVAAHCPVANSFLRSGAFDLAAARAARLRIAVGSDIGAGYERSMIRVAKAVMETAVFREHHSPSAQEMWWQITAGNASSIGWNKAIGHLNPGYEADICLIRPTIPWRNTLNPLATVMYAWDDRWLDKTIIAGRVVQ
jgi:guanine deaminase